MAYSKTPSLSTYETKRIGILSNPQQRSGATPTKDARMINVLPELFQSESTEAKRFVTKSRPGLTSAYTVNSGTARGMYLWLYSSTNYVITVVGTGVYVNGTSLTTIGTSTGQVGFTEYINDVGTVSLIMLDGTNGYIFSSPLVAPTPITPSVWTTVTVQALNSFRKPTTSNGYYYKATVAGTTAAGEPVWPTPSGATVVDGTVTWTAQDGDFPTPHIPHPIFMDGYLFVGKASSQDIYNSNLNDPTLWTAGDYASAEMYPDTLRALSKNNNYLYAIGANTIEYLYDAANPTGSPLGRHESAVQQFGTPAPATVVQTDNEVILVGQTANGGYTVWSISGFKEKEIGTPATRGALFTEGSSLATAKAYCIRTANQKLYVLCLSSRTLVYSFDTKMWTEWNSGATGATTFLCNIASDGPNGTPYLLHRSGTTVYTMSDAVFTDNGTEFRCEIVTAKEDFDSLNRKFMSRLSIVGDIPDSAGVNNDVSIEWSDDDYNTWSTARTLSFNYDDPSINQLGSFRRRAFRIRYSLPQLFRIDGLEVDINKGNS